MDKKTDAKESITMITAKMLKDAEFSEYYVELFEAICPGGMKIGSADQDRAERAWLDTDRMFEELRLTGATTLWHEDGDREIAHVIHYRRGQRFDFPDGTAGFRTWDKFARPVCEMHYRDD